jgi:hypothetical protein
LNRPDREDPRTNEEAFAYLKVSVKDPDPRKVGRAFSNKVVEMALAHYPGFTMTSGPSEESAYAVYWPALLPSELVPHRVVLGEERIEIPPVLPGGSEPAVAVPEARLPAIPAGPTRRVPLGRLVGARSGDKGGNANVGVFARSPEAYAWLDAFLTVERFRELIAEARGLPVERYALGNLLSLNFVVVGLLGEGVAASTRSDPQAKTLGEYLRAKLVPIPEALL